MEELVSIVMPTYNCANFIEESIKSVLAQHYRNWELLIVDDCSTDNTKAVLAPYLAKYSNIRYTCLEKNSGTDVARSEALKQAKGDYVAFLDSDDLWTPNKLSLQIDFMKKQKAAFSATGYDLLRGTPILHKTEEVVLPLTLNYKQMLYWAYLVATSTVIYDRRVIKDTKIQNLGFMSNLVLWLKMLHVTPTCYSLPDILAKKQGNIRPKYQSIFQSFSEQWHLYRTVERLNFAKSAWYILWSCLFKWAKVGIKKRDFEKEKKRNIADSVLDYE